MSRKDASSKVGEKSLQERPSPQPVEQPRYGWRDEVEKKISAHTQHTRQDALPPIRIVSNYK